MARQKVGAQAIVKETVGWACSARTMESCDSAEHEPFAVVATNTFDAAWYIGGFGVRPVPPCACPGGALHTPCARPACVCMRPALCTFVRLCVPCPRLD
mmetsp:Transcript_99500/g.167771  ORF Transcript_99500/g.167771 Transcript_99500/m.167771 type:complete len:99 (-) Transcript_99500:66-362(-)